MLNAVRQNSKADSEVLSLNGIEVRMSDARSAIYKLKSFTDSKNLRAERARYAIVTGPVGAGKSHLLAHVADHRLSTKEPTVLLIGQSFSDTDIWGQVGALLDIPERTSDEILSLLSTAAERQGKRALVLVDAINEGVGADFWRARIAGLLTQAKAYPELAFVFSCREEYLSFAFPKSVIEEASVFRIEGFQTIQEMEAAAEKYLDLKGIARPNTPWLSPEFRNPLFFKSTSEALQAKGEVEFPKGLHGISQLMSFYLDSLSMRTGLASVDYDLLATAIKRTVQSIAGKMVKTGEDFVELTVVDKIVNDEFAQLSKPTNTTWLNVLTRSSVLRRDPPPSSIDIYTSSNWPNALAAKWVSSSGVYSDSNINVFRRTDNPARRAGALSNLPRFCCLPDSLQTHCRARAFSSPSDRCNRQTSTQAILAISNLRNTASALR